MITELAHPPTAARPDASASPLAITLRPAVKTDLPFLRKHWQSAMSPHFRAAGLSPEQEDPERRLRMDFDIASIILRDGDAIGMLKLDRAAQPWRLVQLLLAPEAQGQGLGTALLRTLTAEADARGAAMELSVLKSNPAKRLYQRLGFATVAEEPLSWTMRRSATHPANAAQP